MPTRPRLVAITALLALASAACSPSLYNNQTSGSTTTTDGGDVPAAAGEVAGTVTTSDGRPARGAQVMVDSKELTAQVEAVTAADGTYRVQIAPAAAESNFEVYAWWAVEYSGATWHLPLEPQGATQFWGEDGLTVDFVARTQGEGFWATTGTDESAAYHGFAVELAVYDQHAGDGFASAMQLPAGSIIEVTFTPTGPLIDGSSIDPFTRTVTVTELTGSTDPFPGDILDVPIGTYSVTATVDGQPVGVGSTCNSTDKSLCPNRHDPLGQSTDLQVAPISLPNAPYQSHAAADVLLHLHD